ncbi:MAG: hypothetical protein A2W19_02205 [Spirochaetes bacterium RBG_16_49_21]|nr:MAG: hypothetical protein A2W19_02205 [Spirochaetes bacterium RBG_16_49_21]
MDENYIKTHYIFDKSFRCNEKQAEPPVLANLLSNTVTDGTLKFFRSLEQRFAVPSIKQLDDHFSQVGKYLGSGLKESEARRLFGIYKKYLMCEIDLGSDRKYQANSQDPFKILVLLNRIQNFRRDRLGKKTADGLYGCDVKEREYVLRRSIIITDKTLYGNEKESNLQRLKSGMWGGQEVLIGENAEPYNRYQLKLLLYVKDLSELSERERKLKISEFRKEFFSKEEIQRLKALDDQLAKEKQDIERYRAAEKAIERLKNITQEEKNERINSLQQEFFGKDAEAFRRREAMRKGAEKKGSF